jgi:hypothetical protein
MLEHDLRINRFNRAYQVWRGTGGNIPSWQTRAWHSKMRVKYAMADIDQATVNVVQGAPKAICTARHPDSVGAAKAMEQILGYYADLDHLSETEPIIVQQALVYGVSPAKTTWLYQERDQIIGWDPEEQRWNPRKVKIVSNDRPTLIPWDVYDIWWDPVARDPDAASYVVLRDYPTKDELQAQAYNPDTRIGMLSNLDLLFASGTAGQPSPSAQNQILGNPQNRYDGRYERWEIWRGDRLTILGNRKVLLYDGPKPNWLPGKPVVIGNVRPDFLRIEGISETELVDDLQQAQQSHDNLLMENMKMTIMRGATVRETVPDINQLVLRPNYMWPVTDHDDVHFQDPPPLPPEAYEQSQALLGKMQYVTGINPSITGGTPQASANDTATGASTAFSAASKLLEFKARMIALKVYQRTYEQWTDYTKQFLTQPMWVKIAGPPDPNDPNSGWKQYGPQDVYGDFSVRVQAGEESLNRAQARAEAVAVGNTLAPYIQMFPSLAKKIVEHIGLAYGWEDIDSVIAEMAPPPGAAPPPAAPNGNGNQPPMAPPPNTNMAGLLLPHPNQAILGGNAR